MFSYTQSHVCAETSVEETPGNLVLLANAVKKFQISKCIGMQAGFIGDPFSWKRLGLAKVGVRGYRFRGKQDEGGKSKGSQRLGWQTRISDPLS